MRVVLCKDPDEAADRVAAEILESLGRKADLVLGLATGSTPIGVYRRLARARAEQGARFREIRTFNLDEYVGLPAEHPQSYRSFMRRYLFDDIDVLEDRIHFPPSEGPRLAEKCREFEELIRSAGGIDIQILGIGSNGHIGFNEPTSSLASRTRIKTLAEKTMRDNSRFYAEGEYQPSVASTMGIGTILEAKRILLQAFGTHKAKAVQAAVEGPISSFCPGSALQLHPDVTFYLDSESASRLTLLDYYRQVEEKTRELDERGLL